MYNRPYGPIAYPLLHTSPTINEDLRACFLRVAFQNDPKFSKIRPLSTTTLLGLASHQLLEAAARGEFDSTPDNLMENVIHQRWILILQLAVKHLQKQAVLPIPIFIKWPKYALRMVGACRTAIKITKTRRHFETVSSRTDTASYSQNEAEVWYEGWNRKLVGRIDLIRHTNTGIEVIEFKSGIVIEQSETEDIIQHIREPYERQVSLYSALVYENEGQWPIAITVESLLDGSHMVQVTPEDAKKAVDEALRLLTTYNHMVAIQDVIATPTPATCLWCTFKALCNDFLKAADTSWIGSPVTVIGRLTDIHIAHPCFLSLEILGGNHSKGHTTIRGVPVKLMTKFAKLEGSVFSFNGLKRESGTEDLFFDWCSSCWNWSSLARAV